MISVYLGLTFYHYTNSYLRYVYFYEGLEHVQSLLPAQHFEPLHVVLQVLMVGILEDEC